MLCIIQGSPQQLNVCQPLLHILSVLLHVSILFQRLHSTRGQRRFLAFEKLSKFKFLKSDFSAYSLKRKADDASLVVKSLCQCDSWYKVPEVGCFKKGPRADWFYFAFLGRINKMNIFLRYYLETLSFIICSTRKRDDLLRTIK